MFVSISNILFCILYVTNPAAWLQDFNKLTYCMTYFRAPISSIVSGVW